MTVEEIHEFVVAFVKCAKLLQEADGSAEYRSPSGLSGQGHGAVWQ